MMMSTTEYGHESHCTSHMLESRVDGTGVPVDQRTDMMSTELSKNGALPRSSRKLKLQKEVSCSPSDLFFHHVDQLQ